MTESPTPNPGMTEPPAPATTDDVRDELPHDLDPSGFVGPYQFPDNSRRRWPGVIYLVIAAACVAIYFGFPDSPIVNVGWLVAAQGAVGFPIGHASAQQVWRGLRSRPTWRVLCYSAEEPPAQRGLVLVDAIDGEVIQHLVEPNPDADVLL